MTRAILVTYARRALLVALLLANLALLVRALRSPAAPPPRPHQPTPFSPLPAPVAALQPFGFDETKRPAVLAFAQRLNAALQARDLAAVERLVVENELLEDLRPLLTPANQISFHVGALSASAGDLVLGDFDFLIKGPGVEASFPAKDCVIASERLRCTLPHAFVKGAQLTAARGELHLDLDRQWIEADLQLTIAGASPVLAITLPMGWAFLGGAHNSMQLVEVSQAGVACQVVRFRRTLLVKPPHPGETVELRLRYRGWPDRDPDGSFAKGHALFSQLLPWIEGSRVALDVDVHVRLPAGSPPATLVAGPASLALPGPDRWYSLRAQTQSVFGLLILVGPQELAALQPLPELTAVLYSDAALLDDERRQLDELLPLLLRQLAPLGALPYRQLLLARVPRHGGPEGQITDEVILLASEQQLSPATVAHELAHQWFGRSVLPRRDQAGRWIEGVAEYLSGTTLSPVEATHRREGMAEAYDRIAPKRDVALSSEAMIDEEDARALSYGKALLLMQMLESEIGKDAVLAYLRSFAERYRDRSAGWDELVQHLEERQGKETARWFRAWIERPGAPTLQLLGMRESDGTFHGSLEQLDTERHPAGAAPFSGTVEVAVQDGERTVSVHPVKLSGRRTSFVVPLPESKDALELKVVLDPSYRFVRHGVRTWRDGEYTKVTTEIPLF